MNLSRSEEDSEILDSIIQVANMVLRLCGLIKKSPKNRNILSTKVFSTFENYKMSSLHYTCTEQICSFRPKIE